MVLASAQSPMVGSGEAVQGYRYAVPARMSCLPEIRGRFREFLFSLKVSGAETDMLTLGFTEALSNAIRHGCDEDPAYRVMVDWRRDGNRIHLAFTQPGDGPPAELLAEPELPVDPFAEDGRGLFIIHQAFDEVRHWRGEDSYCLELTRTLDDLPILEPVSDELTAVLEELSNSYESLAAFHRMGSALINAEHTAEFMAQGLESLALMHADATPDLILVCLSDAVCNSVRDELESLPNVTPYDRAPELVKRLIRKGDSFFWQSQEHVRDEPRLAEFGCGCCFPILASGVTLGCLVTARRGTQLQFAPPELNNLRTFTDLFGIALGNANLQVARRTEQRAMKELEVAAEIQRTLLPVSSPPKSDDWEIVLRHQSALEVAGDFLEAARDAEGNLVLTVIDVMGKGVSAAILATIYRTGFLMHLSTGQPLAEIAASLNRVLCTQLGEMTMFVTCGLVRVSRDLETIEVVNAGHCPVLLMDRAGRMDAVDPSGPPLGLFPDAEYESRSFSTEDRDAVLMVTDGMYEWQEGESWWGWDNLVRAAEKQVYHDPLGFWEKVRAMISESQGDDEVHDDQTMLFWRKRK